MTHERRQPHPPARDRELKRYTSWMRRFTPGAIAEGLIRAQFAPLDVPGLGRVVLRGYRESLIGSHFHDEAGHAFSLLPALAADGGPPALPIALSLAPDGQEVVWLRTVRQWRALVDAWRGRKAAMHSRAALIEQDVHDEFDVIAGVTPVLDAEGSPLGDTALAGLEVREAKLDALKRDVFTGHLPASGLEARLLAEPHPAEGELSTDVATAREQLLDRIDRAADERRRWLLDDPHDTGAGAATAVQAAELQRLEERRQAGRRALRRAGGSLTLLRSAAASAEALVRGAGIEAAPVWKTQAGAAIAGGRYAVSAPAPNGGRWTHTIRAGAPPPTVTGKSAAALGGVALDHVDAPAGWTVTGAPRTPPNAHELDVTIAQTAAPAPGTVELALTARNACGPRDLVVAVTVPEAAAAGESS